MKTWKQSVFFGLVAIIAIAFTACPPNGNDTTHSHEYGTAWVSNETQHWHECSCGEKSDVANHTWGNWTQTKPPSITEEGEETRTCSICTKTEKQPIVQLIACTCNPKEHLGIGETCDCGGSDCNCTLQEYGELFPDSGIKIYRIGALMTEFTDAVITTAVNNARTASTEIVITSADIAGKVDEIHIYRVADDAPTYFFRNESGRLIVGFRSNRSSSQMMGPLAAIVNGNIQPIIVQIQP